MFVNDLQHEAEGTHFMKSSEVANAFSKHFQSIHNNSWPEAFPVTNHHMEVLFLAFTLGSDVQNAMK
jgi:hypothetical protein